MIALGGQAREDSLEGVDRMLARPLEIAGLVRALRELSSL